MKISIPKQIKRLLMLSICTAIFISSHAQHEKLIDRSGRKKDKEGEIYIQIKGRGLSTNFSITNTDSYITGDAGAYEYQYPGYVQVVLSGVKTNLPTGENRYFHLSITRIREGTFAIEPPIRGSKKDTSATDIQFVLNSTEPTGNTEKGIEYDFSPEYTDTAGEEHWTQGSLTISQYKGHGQFLKGTFSLQLWAAPYNKNSHQRGEGAVYEVTGRFNLKVKDLTDPV